MKLSEAIKKAQAWVSTWWKSPRPPIRLSARSSISENSVTTFRSRRKTRRPSGTKLKEIKFRVNIDDHDYLTKIRHGEQFLDRGNKVRVQLQFRGREMAHQEFGMQLMHKVRDDLATMAQVEMEPKIAGRNITMTLSPLPANKRKRRFSLENEEIEEDNDGNTSSSLRTEPRFAVASFTRARRRADRLIGSRDISLPARMSLLEAVVPASRAKSNGVERSRRVPGNRCSDPP